MSPGQVDSSIRNGAEHVAMAPGVSGRWWGMFLIWQSATWNAQGAALRMFVVIGLILLFVSQSWEDVSK